MNRADRKRWASAQTLNDLGELTACWLAGELVQTPNHAGPPCAETIELIDVLAAANRAGFVTESSQPGRSDIRQSGSYAECGMQRAAVQGFAGDDVMAALRQAVAGTGLTFLASRAPRRTDWRTAIVVTLDDGEPFTWFGATPSRRDLAGDYDYCRKSVVAALQDAWQVTIVDPEWGRNDRLWPALEAFAAALPDCPVSG
jgi:hypothetical protein